MTQCITYATLTLVSIHVTNQPLISSQINLNSSTNTTPIQKTKPDPSFHHATLRKIGQFAMIDPNWQQSFRNEKNRRLVRGEVNYNLPVATGLQWHNGWMGEHHQFEPPSSRGSHVPNRNYDTIIFDRSLGLRWFDAFAILLIQRQNLNWDNGDKPAVVNATILFNLWV